jgi:hypothetical protein
MDNSNIILKDFMGVFPNAASKEYCEKVIARFDYLQETQSEWGETGRGRIWSRQEYEAGISSVLKENDTYFLGGEAGDHLPLEKKDVLSRRVDLPKLHEFYKIKWECYKIYAAKYGALSSISPHKQETSVRIQKYKPSQGYHM